MPTETISLPAAPGSVSRLTVARFGRPGARPQVYIQAGLHADEIPPMLAAHHLRRRLQALDEAGLVRGEVVLVPAANPIGLGQRVLGDHLGRFDLADGRNFNRGYPDLAPAVVERVGSRLTDDPAANAVLIRAAMRDALADIAPVTPAEHLKHALLGLAIGADIVLDVHCDAEAAMHLYTLTPTAETFAPLAALLGCEAVLLATESGGEPFDEACSRPWHALGRRFPGHAIPLACRAATLELRGQAEVSHALAESDAQSILDALTFWGVIEGPPVVVPEPRCAPTPLEGSQPLIAPVPGILVYHRPVGARVDDGERIAEIIDPVTGEATAIRAGCDGVLYARASSRFAFAGKRLGKIAGAAPTRHGPLLSP